MSQIGTKKSINFNDLSLDHCLLSTLIVRRLRCAIAVGILSALLTSLPATAGPKDTLVNGAKKCAALFKVVGYQALNLWLPLEEIADSHFYRQDLRKLKALDEQSENLISLRSKQAANAPEIRQAFLKRMQDEDLAKVIGVGAHRSAILKLWRSSGGASLSILKQNGISNQQIEHHWDTTNGKEGEQKVISAVARFDTLMVDRIRRAIESGSAVIFKTPRIKATNYLMVFADFQIAFHYDPSSGVISRRTMLTLKPDEISFRIADKDSEVEKKSEAQKPDTPSPSVLQRESADPEPTESIDGEADLPLTEDESVEWQPEFRKSSVDFSELKISLAAREWLQKMLNHFPGQEIFLIELGMRFEEQPELADNDQFKMNAKGILRKRLTESQSVAALDAEIEKMHAIRQRVQPLDTPRSSLPTKLNDLIESKNFVIDDIVPDQIYEFTFRDQPGVPHRVRISKDALRFIESHRHGVRWLRYFLKPAQKHGDSGLRTTSGPNHPFTHSIAIMGAKNNYRLGVNFNEREHLWEIVRSYDHDTVYGR